MTDPSYAELIRDIDILRQSVRDEATKISSRWEGWVETDDFAPSAENFAHYLALRHFDLRDLQRRMMIVGLSSLGRAEGRVMPSLDAVANLLRAATGQTDSPPTPAEAFFAGEARIAARAETLLGPLSDHSAVRLMVTLPSEAADDARFLTRLAELGVEAVRINAAHDDEAAWARMIVHVDKAAEKTGRRMKVLLKVYAL